MVTDERRETNLYNSRSGNDWLGLRGCEGQELF
jgi:hypothetical protein